MRRRALVLGLALTLTSACSRGGSRTPAVDERELRSPEARARGGALYARHCALCHGERADGHGPRGRWMKARPANLRVPPLRARMTPGQLLQVLRDGRPRTAMPAWRTLGQRALLDLAAFLWTLPPVGR